MKLTKFFKALPVALIFLLLISHAAGAGEVPFSGGDEITASFDRGRSIVGADIDGDGDYDLLTAGPDTQNEVAWWDNSVGDGSTWIKRSIERGPTECLLRVGGGLGSRWRHGRCGHRLGWRLPGRGLTGNFLRKYRWRRNCLESHHRDRHLIDRRGRRSGRRCRCRWGTWIFSAAE